MIDWDFVGMMEIPKFCFKILLMFIYAYKAGGCLLYTVASF